VETVTEDREGVVFRCEIIDPQTRDGESSWSGNVDVALQIVYPDGSRSTIWTFRGVDLSPYVSDRTEYDTFRYPENILSEAINQFITRRLFLKAPLPLADPDQLEMFEVTANEVDRKVPIEQRRYVSFRTKDCTERDPLHILTADKSAISGNYPPPFRT